MIGSFPGRSTVITSPTLISAAGICRTIAAEPAGMVGDIDPVLKRMIRTSNIAAAITQGDAHRAEDSRDGEGAVADDGTPTIGHPCVPR